MKRFAIWAAPVLGAGFAVALVWHSGHPRIPGLPVDGEPLSGPEVRQWIALWKAYEAADTCEPVYPRRGDGGTP